MARKKAKTLSNAVTTTNREGLYGLLGATHNGTRKMYDVLGYPNKISFEDYLHKYKRQDVAKRVIEAYPTACWVFEPEVTDKEEDAEKSPFEKAVVELFRKKRVINYLQRLDILSGIGRYGILYIGLNDKYKNQPVKRKYTMDDILFFQVHSEETALISMYGNDPQNSRYNLPDYYTLSTGGKTNTRLTVHHSRVIHVAENTTDNDIYGTPRLEAIWNRLIDLEKVVGGSSETFYLNSRGALHINAEPNSKPLKVEETKTQIEEFSNGLIRTLATVGLDVKAVEFAVASPTEHYNTLMFCISAATGIPMRILTGSEQGKLASGQDQTNWASRVHERQTLYCEQYILRPFLDWCINVGILPEPKNGTYTVNWRPLFTLTELEKSDVSFKKAQALSQYTNSENASLVIPPKQFVEDFLGLDYRSKHEGTTQLPTIVKPQNQNKTIDEIPK